MDELEKNTETKTEKKFFNFKSGKLWVKILAFLGAIWLLIKIAKDFEWATKKFYEYQHFIFNLPNIIYWVLVAILVICVSFLIYFSSVKKTAPKEVQIYSSIFIFLILIVLLRQGNDSEKKYVIVSDNYIQNDFSFSSINIENKKLSQLPVLIDSKHFKPNTVFISTVDRPNLKWAQTFPKGLKLDVPVLSIQEIIDNNQTGIIDISLSSFAIEINKTLQNLRPDSEIRIFYEYEFIEAEKKLSEFLFERQPDLIINSILYNDNNKSLLLDKNVTAIFLGSPKGISAFATQAKSVDYKNLIIPSWLRHTIKENTNPTKNYCTVSKAFNKLIKSEDDTWKSLISIIDKEYNESSIEDFQSDIQAKVIAHFTKEDETITINF